ncbi:hypothetical protein ACFLX3_03135 [Chloroflexota bacterium]
MVLIAFKFLGGLLTSGHESIIFTNFYIFVPRFFAYLMWLGLFIGPSFVIFAFDLWRRVGKKRFLLLLLGLAALTLIVTFFLFPISSLHIQEEYLGEMNLGGAEVYVSESYLSIALFFVILVAEMFIVGIALDLKHNRGEKIIFLFCWIMIPIILMSLTRAANRYMLTVLVPLSLYISMVVKRVYSERTKLFVTVVLLLHVLIFLALGFYANY